MLVVLERTFFVTILCQLTYLPVFAGWLAVVLLSVRSRRRVTF